MPDSILCPKCMRRSYHRVDVVQRYCPHCHQFHSQMDEEQILRDLKDKADKEQ